MSIKIDTANSIVINGRDTGLKLAQRREGSLIYTPERRNSGQNYEEHPMPFARYSAAHDAPHKPGESYDPAKCAGRGQLDEDVLALLSKLAA